MILIKKIVRPIQIIYIIFKYNLISLILNKNNFIHNIIINILKKKQSIKKEKKIRLALEELGPIFIKLGQILSTRSDIFPKNIINELEKLQTNTSTIPFNKIKKIIENSLKTKIENIFKSINENPLSSASIAQIHTAILKNNEKIAIKILKPNIKNLLNIDLQILKILATIIDIFFKNTERFKLKDIIIELKNILHNEINLKYEALNLIKIKKNMNKNKTIYIPNICWSLVRKNILATEYIDGINITNIKKIKKAQLNTKSITENLLNLFYTQVFKYNIFHADLHPGNILISKNNINKPIIILIDFGIISDLEDKEKFYLAENILAFAKKDYKKVAELHIKAQTISTQKSINNIENELCLVFEPILNKEIKDISFKKTIDSLLTLTKKFKLQIQPQLILFQKTLLTIESLCRQLNPNLNIWILTKLSLEKILLKTIITKKIIQNIKNIMTNKNTPIKKNTNKKHICYKNKIINKIFSKTITYFLMGYIVGTMLYITYNHIL